MLDFLDAASELHHAATQAIITQSNIAIASYRLQALSGILLPSMGMGTKKLYATPPPAVRDPREKY